MIVKGYGTHRYALQCSQNTGRPTHIHHKAPPVCDPSLSARLKGSRSRLLLASEFETLRAGKGG